LAANCKWAGGEEEVLTKALRFLSGIFEEEVLTKALRFLSGILKRRFSQRH